MRGYYLSQHTFLQIRLSDFSVFHFIVLLIIIASDGSHQTIPKQKIQTIVSFKVLMMLIVIHRCVDPFANPCALKILWKQFPTQMAIHIIKHLKQKEKEQMCFGYWNGINEYNKNSYFQNCF